MTDKFSLGGVNTLSFVDTDGLAFSIFFQGCTRGCKNCHNPDLLDHTGGEVVTIDSIMAKIMELDKVYDYVCFLGGEPMEQEDALYVLLRKVRGLGIKTWLYTGFDYEQIPKRITEQCNVIVAGAYIESLATDSFPASSNQVIIRNNKLRRR